MKLPIPNMLSIFRLAAAPAALALAVAEQRDAFFILVIVSLATDLLDGPIARWTGQASSAGARLDTIADAATLLAGACGLVLLEGAGFRPFAPGLILFLATYAAAAAASLRKFGRLPAYHLYLSKAAAFCSGAFFISIYLFGFSGALLAVVLALGIAANVESLLVTQAMTVFRTDVRSLCFVLGSKRGDPRRRSDQDG